MKIKRYIFKFPLSDEIKGFILKEEYFVDEVFELEEIHKEYMIADMMNFKISTLLTLRDLMIIKRLFKMVGLLNSDYLFNILETHEINTEKVYGDIVLENHYNEKVNEKRNTSAFRRENHEMTTGQFKINHFLLQLKTII